MRSDREVVVLPTHSIRAKMSLILGGVAILLVLLAGSGASALLWYRHAVGDLEYSVHHAPRRADLSDAFGGLFEPLLGPVPESQGLAEMQAGEFGRRLNEAREAVLEFRRRLDQQPVASSALSGAQRPVTDALLADVDRTIERLDELRGELADESTRPQTVREMLAQVGHLETLARRLPDSRRRLSEAIQQAQSSYRFRLWMLGSVSTVVGGLFVLLVAFGYRAIFAPLRVLHQGASRVAQGDFDFRVRLDTRDEMADLADSFNQMTTRFQEIAGDLDRQVQERGRQLLRSERLANVGFLAAGVAHEINNPLSAIAMAGESVEGRLGELLADRDGADVEVVRQYLGMIQREAFRCQDITRRLLDFSRGQESARTPTDVTALVSEVLALVGHLGKFRGRTIEFSPEGSCFLEIAGGEIKQVVLNLVANALESMEPGGRLAISLVEHPDGAWLEFRDDGCGMTPDVLENLFEPFFTRRRDGRGTGLGLSISHRIVSDHGGRIEVSSPGPGCGSTFRVYLPRRAAVPAAQAAA